MADKNDKIAAARRKLKQFRKSTGAKSGSQVDGAQQINIPSHLLNQSFHTLQVNLFDQQEENSDVLSIENLKKENLELSLQLQKQIHLNNQLNELKDENAKLSDIHANDKKSLEDRFKRELGSLKEQLQVHIQTIGILVAEKTELQSAINQYQKLVDSKQTEVECLKTQLKTCTQPSIEHDQNHSNDPHEQNERASKELLKEIDKLKMDLFKVTKSNEEFQLCNLEIQGKLQKRETEVQKLTSDLADMEGRLLEARDHQVENVQCEDSSDISSYTDRIESLTSEKVELERRLEMQEDLIMKMRMDYQVLSGQKTHESDQSRQKMSDLHEQMKLLAVERHQLRSLNTEKQDIINRLQSDQEDENMEEASLNQQLATLRSDILAANRRLDDQISDNSELNKLLLERDKYITELELAFQKSNVETSAENNRLEDRVQELEIQVGSTQTTSQMEIESSENQLEPARLNCSETQDSSVQVPENDGLSESGMTSTDTNLEVMQQSMKLLETKYTSVMRDKADLLDKMDQMEHVMLQLQGESETIGEYVSLYQQQRFVLRKRMAEKDGYIHRLTQERIELQSKFVELQTLVVCLLNERQHLYNHQNNVGHALSMPDECKLNSAGADIVQNGELDPAENQVDNSSTCHSSSVTSSEPVEPDDARHRDNKLSSTGLKSSCEDIPEMEDTAQKIMHLLDEIGSSNASIRDRGLFNDSVPCSHCHGILLVV